MSDANTTNQTPSTQIFTVSQLESQVKGLQAENASLLSRAISAEVQEANLEDEIAGLKKELEDSTAARVAMQAQLNPVKPTPVKRTTFNPTTDIQKQMLALNNGKR